MDYHLVEKCLFCEGHIIIHDCKAHGSGLSHTSPLCQTYDDLSGYQILKLLLDQYDIESFKSRIKN
jgi:hypothetical protein